MTTEKLFNPGDYRQKLESVRVPKKLSGPVRKNGRTSVSTETLFNPGDYGQKLESVRVPTNCPDQFEKMVESV